MKKRFNRVLDKNEMIAIGNMIAKELELDKPVFSSYVESGTVKWVINFNYYMIDSEETGHYVAGPFNSEKIAISKIKQLSKKVSNNTKLKNNFLFKPDIDELFVREYKIDACIVSYDQEEFTAKIRKKYNIYELLEKLKASITALSFNI